MAPLPALQEGDSSVVGSCQGNAVLSHPSLGTGTVPQPPLTATHCPLPWLSCSQPVRHPRQLGRLLLELWKGCRTLQAQCSSVSTRLGLRGAAAFQVPLSERARPAARMDPGFLPGCGRAEPGGRTKRGFRPRRGRGEGPGAAGPGRSVPFLSPGAAVPRGLGSVHPELPAALLSDLPSLLHISHKSGNGDFQTRYLFIYLF